MRGNGKVIQELEAVFRGAGWNVVKVILGSKWDELLISDKDGVLLNKLNTTLIASSSATAPRPSSTSTSTFSGLDHRLRQLVAHLSDEDLVNLPRGGHDYRKLYGHAQGGHGEPRFRRPDGDPADNRVDARTPTSKGATPPTRSRR